MPSADAEEEQRAGRPQSAGRSASPVKMMKRPARHEKESASLGETEAGGYVLAAAEAAAEVATEVNDAGVDADDADVDADDADVGEGDVEVALGGLEEKEEEEDGKDGSKGGGDDDDENGVVEVELHSDAGMLEASDPGLDKVSPDAALGEVDSVVDSVVGVDVGGPAPSSARSAREMAQAYTSKELKDMALTLGVSQTGKKVDVCHRILTARAASRGGPAE